MHEADPKVRAAQLDEGTPVHRSRPRLGVPYVRVFGDKVPPGETAAGRDRPRHRRAADARRACERKRRRGHHRVARRLHRLAVAAADPRGRSDAERRAAVGCSPYHAWPARKPRPATYKLVGLRPPYAPEGLAARRHGVRYVLTGSGTVPVRETVAVLAKAGYRGYYGFEWEKAWHPEIEEPEVAFPTMPRSCAAR